MKALVRLSLCTGLLGALVAGAGYACPALSARLGLRLEEWAALQHQLEESRRQSEQLDRQSAGVLRRLHAKQEVIEALKDGQLTLLEAAARFRDLDHTEPPVPPELFRLLFRYPSDAERWCRQVIGFLENRNSFAEGPTSLAWEMESELCRHLEQGTLELPN